MLAAVEHADHVRVLEPGGGLGLAPEALHELLVLGEAPVEHLQRHVAPEVNVLRAVHVGHPAGAEPSHHPVAAVHDRVVGHLGHPPSRLSST